MKTHKQVTRAVAKFLKDGGLIEKLPPAKAFDRIGFAQPSSLGNHGITGTALTIDQTAGHVKPQKH